MRYKKLVILSVVCCLLIVASCLLFVNSVEAQSFGNPVQDLKDIARQTKDAEGKLDPLGKAELPAMIGGVLYGVLGFLGVLCLLAIIYAGVKWTMAGGNQEAITNARQIIKYAIIGVIVVLGAYALSIYILSAVLDVTGPRGADTSLEGGMRGGPCETSADCPADYQCVNRQCRAAGYSYVDDCGSIVCDQLCDQSSCESIRGETSGQCCFWSPSGNNPSCPDDLGVCY